MINFNQKSFILKRNFHHSAGLLANRERERELRSLNAKMRKQEALESEVTDLREDKNNIQTSLAGLAQKESNIEATEEQKNSLEELKTNYDVFFESDSETEEEPSSFEKTPEYKTRQKIHSLNQYLNSEILSNIKQQEIIAKEIAESKARLSGLDAAEAVVAESTSGSSQTPGATTSGSSQTPGAATSGSSQTPGATTSSSSQSPLDYVLNKPTDYNPFDDIGED